jgi:uncharacterized protein involved in exopolysaccharide biosynthesis
VCPKQIAKQKTMDEIFRQAITSLKGVWKHRWLGLTFAWVAGATGFVTVFCIPDKYLAWARIDFDNLSILKPLMASLAIDPASIATSRS